MTHTHFTGEKTEAGELALPPVIQTVTAGEGLERPHGDQQQSAPL